MLMESNAFRRLLYKTIAKFLRKAKVDVEHRFPWIARYTEDVGRDAPSQIPLYSAVMEKFRDKRYIGSRNVTRAPGFQPAQ